MIKLDKLNHTTRHSIKSHAVDMEPSVAQVTEQHLVIVGGLSTRAARFALGALPRVLATFADRVCA